MRKDIQRCKFLIGLVCGASILILLGSVGDNQREIISNEECIRKGMTGLFLLGLALFTNYLLDKEVKKDERNRSSSTERRNSERYYADRNNAR